MRGSNDLHHELADFAIALYSAGVLNVPGFDQLPLEEKVRWGAYAACVAGEQKTDPLRGFYRLAGRKWHIPSPSYDTVSSAPIKHLLFHVYPYNGNGAWLQNVMQIRQRLHIFDGRKVVAIAQDNKTEDARDVMDLLPGCEFLVLPNDPVLRETATFQPLLLTVYDQPGMTFYCHSKASTSQDDLVGGARWRNAMYHHLLDRWPECMEKLRDYPCVITTKMCWPTEKDAFYPSGLKRGTWMGAGTFFWINNRAVFRKGWRNIAQDRYGVESWLGGLFEADQAYSIYQPWDEWKPRNPYDPTIYGPEFDDLPVHRPGRKHLRIGLDLDQTVYGFPEFFRVLIPALVDKGHEIFCTSNHKLQDWPKDVERLTALGIDPGLFNTSLMATEDSDPIANKVRMAADLNYVFDDFVDLNDKVKTAIFVTPWKKAVDRG